MTRTQKLTWNEFSKGYKEKTKFLKSIPPDDFLQLVGYNTTTDNTLEEAQERRLNKLIVENHILGETV